MAHGRRVIMQNRVEYVYRGTARPRMLAGEHFIQNNPEGEQITPRVRDLSGNLFRRHIANRAEELPRMTYIQSCDAFRVNCRAWQDLFRQTKIQHLHVAVGANHNVCRFEVAMHDTRTVSCGERLKYLFRDVQPAPGGKTALKQIAQSVA